ncbi:MAG TPA: glycerophosphodiester phosphodiesterase [Dehalococcoidia bacterium]
MERPRRPLVIAHAACKGHAPENTLAGLRAALSLRVDAIEIDVRGSRDGVPVLMHDETVDRTTNGTGPVRGLTAAELAALDAGNGEPVPTLAQALAAVGRDARLFVEIKEPGVEEAVLREIRRAGAADAAIHSFSRRVIARVKELAPRFPCALITGDLPPEGRERFFADALHLQAEAVSVHYSSLDAETVAAAHAHDLLCFAWTADDPAEVVRLLDAGVDGVISNYPERVRDALRARRGR